MNEQLKEPLSAQAKVVDATGSQPSDVEEGVYSREEVESAVEVFRILIRVRDRARDAGLIDW